MKSVFQLLTAILAFSFIACQPAQDKSSSAVDTIYYGGDIITMEGDSATYAEAVAILDGKIVFVGTKAEAEKLKGDSTIMNDLRGKTLLPGFIDSHIHWGQFVLLSGMDNINPVEIKDVDAYLTHLKKLAENTPEGEWIISYGYEKVLIPPFKNLLKEDLNNISSKHPIFIVYNNFHWATANSVALEKLNLTKSSPTDMPGGGIVFKDKQGEPTGLLTESALHLIMPVVASLVSPEKQAVLPFEIAKQLNANGLTTIADLSSGSAGGRQEIMEFQKLANDPRFGLRISATTLYELVSQMNGPIPWDGHFQAINIKLLLDASLAGGTSATIKPQLNGSTGNLNYTSEEYEKALQVCMDKGFGVTTHVMGDRAHKVMLQAMENLAGKYDYTKMHNTIEHSALIDPADIPRIKNLNLSVGFLTPFLHLYGNPMNDLVYGPEMASRLFAAASYDQQGINSCHHSDAPIVAAKPLYLVSCAVNRSTTTGIVLGPTLKQTPYAALLGVTRNAARHLGLGNEIGSLGTGKMADFVILDHNPLKVEPMKIKDIIVTETIKEGKTFYKK